MTKAEELALEISYATSDVDISYDDWLLKLENLQVEREGAWNKMATITEDFKEKFHWRKKGKFSSSECEQIEKFWMEKLKEKDQVIDKLIEDRPFDIKDALDAQKETIKKEIERKYNHFGDPDNCEICKILKEIINYLKEL